MDMRHPVFDVAIISGDIVALKSGKAERCVDFLRFSRKSFRF